MRNSVLVLLVVVLCSTAFGWWAILEPPQEPAPVRSYNPGFTYDRPSWRQKSHTPPGFEPIVSSFGPAPFGPPDLALWQLCRRPPQSARQAFKVFAVELTAAGSGGTGPGETAGSAAARPISMARV
ncbi:MAG: hypothetical protein AMXMBFR33_51600 [Candidatus Xenobia bacterium]